VFGDIEARFSHMLAEQGTVARDIQDALVEAAKRIDEVAIAHPAVGRVIQFLEQAAGVTASQPALRVSPAEAGVPEQSTGETSGQAADPTSAGQAQPASPTPTSSAPSGTSEGTSNS
jgi:hypothetical protein